MITEDQLECMLAFRWPGSATWQSEHTIAAPIAKRLRLLGAVQGVTAPPQRKILYMLSAQKGVGRTWFVTSKKGVASCEKGFPI